MNKGHQGARQVPVHLIEQPAAQVANGEELELISVSASIRNDSALISITNLDLEADTTVQLGLRGRPVNDVRARLLTADKPQAHNSPGWPDAVVPVALDVEHQDGVLTATLPRHSFATVELQLAR
jgi:alpha-L-arabinofuranosidase